jgi:protein TonB
MELQTLLYADYLDIIFDQRNKKYGGYELRKYYSDRAIKALLFIILSTATLSILSFISHKKSDVINTRIARDPIIHLKQIDHTFNIAPPSPPPAVQHVKTEPFVTFKVVPDKNIPPDIHVIENKKLDNVQVGAQHTNGEAGTNISPGSQNGNGSGGNGQASTSISLPVSNAPYHAVQQMPEPSVDMNDYLNKNLHYPDAARENNVEGRVVLQFVVNENGMVSDIQVVRGIGGGCDEEAVRVLKAMPPWKPGRQNGQAVKVYFILPISFALQ